jgi:hypothetical protein
LCERRRGSLKKAVTDLVLYKKVKNSACYHTLEGMTPVPCPGNVRVSDGGSVPPPLYAAHERRHVHLGWPA